MLSIAGGELKTPLPPRSGNDEITGMVDSLAVFRDTAVEVEEMSLRERQVVLDTIEYGVLILDVELKVRMHNRAFRDLWGLSEDGLSTRPPFPDLLQAIRGHAFHSVSDPEWPAYAERRLAEVQAGGAPPQEWLRPDGRVLQYQITTLPDGGRMLTYFDLTHLKEIETELRLAKDQAELRTRELAQSLDNLRAAQDRLVQTEKLASLGQLTAGIAHEIKNPLNFVNNFSAVSGDLVDELRETLDCAFIDAKLRADVAEITGMLKSNLEKIVHHGKRADSIVRNMLLHSREGSGEHRPISINAVVEESLNLAYHGARAEKKGFNVTLNKSLDPDAGEVDLYPQEMTRVLLNLISNGFYATTKRLSEANGAGYEPMLSASTRNLGDKVEIRIRDNGTGIPSEVKAKMFNPFFTTKPAGEGTGLGLSLSHDIIVKQHAGAIEVETEPGAFTEFRIVLPRGAASIAKIGGHA
ncbi:MAG: PAS-domain containing protein [Rhizobiales bacterium]|nr:PAS-domain containing protein [Hyphomicrobiales bacterium]